MFSRWTDAELTTATARARTAKQFSKNNNADAVVEWNNGKQWVVDFKCMSGNRVKIIDRLNDAYEQADYAIIKMIEPLSPVFIERTIRWFKQREKMKGVMIYCDGKEILQIERK
ncbi:MAG: hypothetical protein NDJ65_04605 [Paludibacteraceae bacterium]|nr:hypothetical protein [Paludibacteraceae bacterium]